MDSKSEPMTVNQEIQSHTQKLPGESGSSYPSITDERLSTISNQMPGHEVDRFILQYLQLPGAMLSHIKHTERGGTFRIMFESLVRWRNMKECRGENARMILEDLLEQIKHSAAGGGLHNPEASTKDSMKDKGPEDDIHTLAELMKSDLENTLKIQRSPWLDWDILEFEDIYLPVGINIENQRTQNVELVREYKDLFAENPDTNVSDTKRRKIQKRHKILIKGAPGVGKTTLVAKMAYDWAVSVWTTFSFIFFVSLKVVKPGDPIECFIIDEHLTPSVIAYDFDLKTIPDLLKNSDKNVLIIFEGFDEGTGNEDVIKIIRNLQYPSCNIIVTTRPHVAGDIQRYFTTVVNVTGFTQADAERYIKTLLSDKGKVESVLEFTEENQSIGIYEMWRYPILLLFICILVNDDGGYLDLNNKNITLSDIYTKLHECLYKRYTIKREIKLSIARMKNTLIQLGKLALKGLEKGRLLYQKSELEREVGEDAFHFGIIVGYQDRRVIHDLCADCTVCFLHSSIQEYLAALYMVDELEWSDRRIEDMWPGTWDYDTVNKLPLLLAFAIDLCKDKSIAKRKLLNSIANVLNQSEMTIHGNNVGHSTLLFLAEVTHRCWETKTLTFVDSGFSDDPLTWFSFIMKMSKAIKKITFNRFIFRKCPDAMSAQKDKAFQISCSQIEISIEESDIPVRTLHFLIAQCQCIHTLSIEHHYLALDEKQFYKCLFDLLSVPLPSLRKLAIDAQRENYYSSSLDDEQPDDLDLDCPTDISKFRGNLPHISEIHVGWNTLYGKLFSTVITESLQGNQCLQTFGAGYAYGTEAAGELMNRVLSLPCNYMQGLLLRDCYHLCDRDKVSRLRQKMISDPVDSNEEVNSTFMLPQIGWVHLYHLVLFTASQMQALTRALHGGPLRILTVNSFQVPFLIPLLQSKGLPELKALHMFYLDIDTNDMDSNSMFTEDKTAVCSLPKLQSLEFKQFHGLMRIHQNILKQFFVAVRGSHYLTVLDISGQNAAACLKTLLFPEGLPALTEFRADDCGLLPVDIYRLGKATKSGKLPSIKLLSISNNLQISNFFCYLFIGSWPCLETLALAQIELTSWDITCLVFAAKTSDTCHCIMPNLTQLLCSDIYFPALKHLMLSGVSISKSDHRQLIHRVLQDISDDHTLGNYRKNISEVIEEIIDGLYMLQDKDEKYHCYGVIRMWVIDLLRRKYQKKI